MEISNVGRHSEGYLLILEQGKEDLNNYIWRLRCSNRVFGKANLARLGLHISAALDYLQMVGSIHGDLKSHNVILRQVHWKVERQIGAFLMADFGTHRNPGQKGRTWHTPGLCTYRYSAPQALGSPTGKKKPTVSMKNDIHSFGCILLFCWTRMDPPETESENLKDYESWLEKVEPMLLELPMELQKLVRDCISYVPEKRPEPSLIHEFFERSIKNSNNWCTWPPEPMDF
jgi:serine/threonine protein kinase